jgi:hypothetical protein
MMFVSPLCGRGPEKEVVGQKKEAKFGNMKKGDLSLQQFLQHLLSRKAEGNGPKKP